jgi:hypothetical protein
MTTYRAALNGEQVLPEEAAKYRYVLVRGLLADKMKFYMKGMESHLQDKGLDVVLTQTNTTGALADNLEMLRSVVLEAAAEGKQVVLIGHSKGGNEVISLPSVYPELKPHIRGVIPMEAPHGGAALASDLTRGPITTKVLEWFCRRIGAFESTAYELSHAGRRSMLARYPVAQEVPLLAMSANCLSPRSLTFLSSLYARLRYGALGRGDGLVVQRDQEVAGKPVVRLNKFDHAGPSFPDWASPGPWKSGTVTESLIAMLLKDANQRPVTPPPGG